MGVFDSVIFRCPVDGCDYFEEEQTKVEPTQSTYEFENAPDEIAVDACSAFHYPGCGLECPKHGPFFANLETRKTSQTPPNLNAGESA